MEERRTWRWYWAPALQWCKYAQHIGAWRRILLSSAPRWLCTNEQRCLYLSCTSEYKFHPMMKGMEVLFIIFIATSLGQAAFHSYFPLLSWTLSSTRAQNGLLKTIGARQPPGQYCLQPHASHRAKLGRVTRSHPLFLIALHPSSCMVSAFLTLGLFLCFCLPFTLHLVCWVYSSPWGSQFIPPPPPPTLGLFDGLWSLSAAFFSQPATLSFTQKV